MVDLADVPLDVLGILDKVLCLIKVADEEFESVEVLPKAAANLLARVAVVTFFDGFRTKARISRMTLVRSFFSGIFDWDDADGMLFASKS